MTKQLSIVLAEDDQFISLAYVAGLKGAGFTVFPASDGEEALEMIRLHKPDIVLLDLIMPIKTGFEVLEEVKSDVSIQDIPIVIFSNLSQESDIAKTKEMGALDYINKDAMTMNEAIEKLKNILT